MKIPKISNIIGSINYHGKKLLDVISIRRIDDNNVYISATNGKIAVRIHKTLNGKINKSFIIRDKFWKILEKEKGLVVLNDKGIYADGVQYPAEDETKRSLIDENFDIFDNVSERDKRFTVEFETQILENMCILARRLGLRNMKLEFTDLSCIIRSDDITIISTYI